MTSTIPSKNSTIKLYSLVPPYEFLFLLKKIITYIFELVFPLPNSSQILSTQLCFLSLLKSISLSLCLCHSVSFSHTHPTETFYDFLKGSMFLQQEEGASWLTFPCSASLLNAYKESSNTKGGQREVEHSPLKSMSWNMKSAVTINSVCFETVSLVA